MVAIQIASMVRWVLFSFVVFSALVAWSLQDAQAATGDDLAAAALDRTRHQVTYDPAYVRLAYPGGDVAPDRGVCADVIVRSYRALGIDLQVLVHEDMAADFASYPQLWDLSGPDRNIDHRRVPNLRRFLERQGAALPASDKASDYKPGDLVTWNLRPNGSLPHIGIVSDRMSANGVPLVVHNIGFGPSLDDSLFAYQITGHYRYMSSVSG